MAADALGGADVRDPPSRSPSVTSSIQDPPVGAGGASKGDASPCLVRVCIAPSDLGALTQRDVVAVLETRVLPARHEVTTASRRDTIKWQPVEEVALPQAALASGSPVAKTFGASLSLRSQAGVRRRFRGSREVRVVYYELIPTVHSEPERIPLAFSAARLEHITEVDAGRLVVPVEQFPRSAGGVPGSVKAALSRRPGGGRRHLPPLTTAFTLEYVRSGVQPVLIDISLTVDRLVGWPFSAARPFFVLYVPRPGSLTSWQPIWRSEVMVASRIVGRSPSEFHYSPVELPPLSSICGTSSAGADGSTHHGNGERASTGGGGDRDVDGDDDDDRRLLVEFFHYKTSGNPRLLGILQTSLNELRAMPPDGGTLALSTPQLKQLVGGARLRFICPVPTGVRYALHFEFGGLTAGACCFLRVSLAFGPMLADLVAARSAGRRKVSAFFVLYCRRSGRRSVGGVADKAGDGDGDGGGGGGGGGGGADEGSSASDTERESWKQLFQSEVVSVDCVKAPRPAGGGGAEAAPVRRFSHLVSSLWRERSDASIGTSRGTSEAGPARRPAGAPAGDGGGAVAASAAGAAGAGAGGVAPYVIPFRYYRIPALGHSRNPAHCELLLSVFLYHPTGNHKQVSSVRTSIAELLAATPDVALPRFFAVPEAAVGASAAVSRAEKQEQRSFVDISFAFPSA